MRKLYIELSDITFRAVQRRACAERRDVRDEVALIVERSLESERRDDEAPGRVVTRANEKAAGGATPAASGG